MRVFWENPGTTGFRPAFFYKTARISAPLAGQEMLNASRQLARMDHRSYSRRAISPIIATVLIIAVTLIAAVAIGGFVFGIFGTSSQAATISVTGTTLTAAGFGTGTSGTITCVTSAPAVPYITLTNGGSAGSQVTGVTIVWAGQNNNFAMTASCTVGAAGLGKRSHLRRVRLVTTGHHIARVRTDLLWHCHPVERSTAPVYGFLAVIAGNRVKAPPGRYQGYSCSGEPRNVVAQIPHLG